jgi:hypothetical protein
MRMDTTYDELLDEAEDQYEDAQEVQEAQIEQAMAFPTSKEKSDLYNWFWKVVRLMPPSQLVRVANLNKTEIGEHGVSVRDAMNLANLGVIFGHREFGRYWASRAKITSTTSMAKNGWFMEMSIIQKKIRERARKSAELTSGKKPWRVFGKKKQATDSQPQQ